MKTDAILNADLLDIIFENRNKEYGAYSLRKFYNNRLYKALGITFTFVAALLFFSFVGKNKPIITPYITGPVVLSPPRVRFRLGRDRGFHLRGAFARTPLAFHPQPESF